ncbi:hypothetical protein HII36_16260 [Nonomuraea sp. NN258]|nr:hypothetical protein [Nonomuraea antri]
MAADVAAQQPAVDPYALTSGRAWSLTAAVLGLVGVVAGGLALRAVSRRRGAVVALAAGVAGGVMGAVALITADGGPGTGNGIVGGVVALVLGVIAVVTGGMARTRAAAK